MPVLTVETAPDGIATLTLNRPEALNAINGEVLDAVHAEATRLAGKARAILLTGAGKAFAAGADIQAMAGLGGDEAREFSLVGQDAFQALASFPGPVVAAINGYALGGGFELAMACDILVASDKAVVGQPEVQLGVVPGFGGSARLPRRVGPGVAKMLLMTGERVKADEALRLGLVDKVVPHDDLLASCRALLGTILQNGPLAVAAVKTLVDDGLDMELGSAMELEAHAFGASFQTSDQKEGMQAFLGKRKPAFTGA